MLENIEMSIGQRIRSARKSANLTQQELAAKVGIRQASLSALETGASATSMNVASLARALGVDAFWLETGKGVPTAPQSTPKEEPAYGLQWISPSEYRLLTFFRGTDERGQDTMLEHAATIPQVLVAEVGNYKR